MKKSILMLSALLTLVVSGFCLQGCSSEFDDYATEEYGYYTEEEIAEIMALAKKYDTVVEIDRSYCGKKSTLKEFEERLIGFMNLPGDYELVKENNSEKRYLKKKQNEYNRLKTRAVEARLEQAGRTSITSAVLPCEFYLSWRLATHREPAVAYLRVEAPYYLYGNTDVVYNAIISDYSISINETCTVHCEGVSYGRYNISGVYYATGEQDFRVIKVPEDWLG